MRERERERYVDFYMLGEAVTKLLVVDPLLAEAEVEHGEGGVPRYLSVNVEKAGQSVDELRLVHGRVRLQQHQARAPGVARLLVDVQLEVLVVVEEAAPDLVGGEVEGVLLVQQMVWM